ncbi:MAG: response regulator [Anaerolineales bacterium]|nr:response regulator [Anaerolineales bacterium]
MAAKACPERSRRVLIVEDQTAFMLRELLELYAPADHEGRKSFEFDIASEGLAALEKLAGPLPDLVLLDLRLPGIGGLAVLDAIHKTASCLPVIVVSAYGDKRTRQEASAAGANYFFQKPVSTMKLYWQIKEFLATAPRPKLTDETQKILIAKQRRLNKLKERQALLGIDAPPELLIEIEDLEGEIKNAESLFGPPR